MLGVTEARGAGRGEGVMPHRATRVPHPASRALAPPLPLLAPTRCGGEEGTMKDENKGGLGDDQGTRVGAPTPGAGKRSGAGSEAMEGMHSADGDREQNHDTALEGKQTGRTDEQSGSEPLGDHDTEHRSKYGGGSRREDGGGQRTP